MRESAANRVLVGVALLAACVAFLPGINWGLPSRAADPFLFGDRRPWSGAEIKQLAPAESGLGADVDANPILNRSQTVILNQTDRDRAEIVRRYRLFSYQPDEMITFKSLSRIREFHGDPRLYQYGGLWIYPVGVLIKVAFNPSADQAYYLDHPESFGRFYVVARLYSAAWGLIAVWATFWIVHRLTANQFLATAGAIAFAFMPVVVTMAHEAKPHLPGLALTLLAAIAAAKFVESGRERWSITAGALCGAAFGMVISSLLAFAVLPVMVMLHPAPMKRRLAILVRSALLGVLAYTVFNPFVAIHLLGDRAMLRSNLGNSTAMYHVDARGAGNAVRLILEGASPILAALAVIGAISLIWRRLRPACACPGKGDVGWLLAGPAMLVAVQFFLLAADKPPEYARFGLLIDVFLLVIVFAAAGRLQSIRARRAAGVAIVAFVVPFAVPYVVAFVKDASAESSRLVAARTLKTYFDQGATTVRLGAEPAPYNTPPIDLFRARLLLPPPGEPVSADVIVQLDARASPAPICWADKRFGIVSTRRGPATTVSSPP